MRGQTGGKPSLQQMLRGEEDGGFPCMQMNPPSTAAGAAAPAALSITDRVRRAPHALDTSGIYPIAVVIFGYFQSTHWGRGCKGVCRQLPAVGAHSKEGWKDATCWQGQAGPKLQCFVFGEARGDVRACSLPARHTAFVCAAGKMQRMLLHSRFGLEHPELIQP